MSTQVQLPIQDQQQGSRRKANITLYHLVSSKTLPNVDLSSNLLTHLLSPQQYERFMNFLRWRYQLIANVYRVGIAVFVLSFFLNRRIGWSFGLITLLMSGAVFINVGLLSIDILKLLVLEYDVWVYSIMNGLNSLLLALALNDFRALGVIPWFLGIQMCILLDANVRTAASAIRGIKLGAPFAVIMGLSVATHFLDTTRTDFRVVHLTKGFAIDLGELCVNWSITLAVVLLRELYNKRALVDRNIIRCVVHRCPLKLDKSSVFAVVEVARNFEAHRASRSPSICHMTTKRGEHLLNLRQSFHMVPPRNHESGIDAWHTIWPQCTPRKPLSRAALTGLYACGITGILLTTASMVLIPWHAHNHFELAGIASNNQTSSDTIHSLYEAFKHQHQFLLVLSSTAIATTLIFVGSLAMSLQRRLMFRLASLFNFWFPSIQLIASSICLMHVTRWDWYACATIASWSIWFHFCLCLDALTPVIKKFFRWQKSFAALIVASAIVSVSYVNLTIMFAPKGVFYDYVVQLPHTRLSVSLRTFLFNRFVTIVLWNLRLVWRCALQAEEELIIVRGTVEYRSPFELLPVVNPYAPIPSTHESQDQSFPSSQ